eukprot:jgi/Botrbrau1/22425/Bobra.0091s0027.1
MTITTGPQSTSILSRLDAYRFYIMAAIGLLLMGYVYIQRMPTQSADEGGLRQSLPGGTSSHYTTEVKEPVAKPKVSSATKVKYTGEPKEDEKWLGLHNKFKYDIEVKSKGQELNIVFYGDSIFESFKGTVVGIPNAKYDGIPEIFAKEYKPKKAAVYAIAGDTTSNLYWRLINGESPQPVQPRGVVMLIGTNDVNKLSIVGEIDLEEPTEAGQRIAKGVIACVQTIQEDCPHTTIILMALLPRGDKSADDKFAVPCKWTGTIEATNKALAAFAKKTDNVEFVDCGAPFVEEGRIREELMPDVLHPNAAGMRTVVECLKPFVNNVGGPANRRFTRHLLSL